MQTEERTSQRNGARRGKTRDGARQTKCHGASQTKCHGASQTKCHGASQTKCHGASQTKCHGASQTKCHGASQQSATVQVERRFDVVLASETYNVSFLTSLREFMSASSYLISDLKLYFNDAALW